MAQPGALPGSAADPAAADHPGRPRVRFERHLRRQPDLVFRQRHRHADHPGQRRDGRFYGGLFLSPLVLLERLHQEDYNWEQRD